ncbi:MAG: hypothetical protein J5847_05060 [Clostridia bacterium]|nr:hypothetical protein [Clostridia bacterium]MBR5753092.1 hypothetical protein [Clostridia bacterium]
MFTFALKITLEVAAIVLLLVGYWNEEKVIAFERRIWARLRASAPEKTHSATYYASREEEQREWDARERRARNAELARKCAARRAAEEPRRAA